MTKTGVVVNLSSLLFQAGMWELRVEAATKTDQPIIGLVYAKPAAKETPILLDVWISGRSSAVS